MELIVKKNGIDNKDKIELDDYINSPDDYEFLLGNDHDIKAYNNDKDEDIKIHDCVLPHPYFGKIAKVNEKDKIVFLAKNPAYEDYKDKQDTYHYLKRHGGVFSNYLVDLENVNFFKPWHEGENISFINTWNWWNKKVFGNVKLKDDYIDNVAFVNICGYQSKYFDESHYETFPNEKLSEILSNADLIFVVWGGAKKINKIKNILKDKEDKHIVLNLCRIENDKEKCSVNINSLETLLKANNFNANENNEETEESKRNRKMKEIYGDKLNIIDDYFELK